MADFVLGDWVLDFGLNVLDEEADKIYICSAEPADYTQATTTFALGNKTTAAGGIFWPEEAGVDFSRRLISSKSFSDGVVTTGGTAVYWAVVDSVNQRLLARGLIGGGGGSVSAGGTFALGYFNVGLGAPLEEPPVEETDWPGYPGGTNPVGYLAAPGYSSLTASPWPPVGFENGPSPEAPNVYSFLDFTASQGVTRYCTVDGSWGGTLMANVKFVGCYFPSNAVLLNASVDARGAMDITWSYCTFGPAAGLTLPNPAWPSSTAGTGLTLYDYAETDPYFILYKDSVEFHLSLWGTGTGTLTVDHCDLWGSGDNIGIGGMGQINITDNWIHDCRKAIGETWTAGATYSTGDVVGSSTDNWNYMSLTDNNIGHDPAWQGDPTNWHYINTYDHSNGIISASAGVRGVHIEHNVIASIGNTNAIAFQHTWPVWEAGLTYNTTWAGSGPYAGSTVDNMVYRSLQDNNIGHEPSVSPTWWENQYSPNNYQNVEVINNYLTGFNVNTDMGSVPGTSYLTFANNVMSNDLPPANWYLYGQWNYVPQFTGGTSVWYGNRLKLYPGSESTYAVALAGQDGYYLWPDAGLYLNDFESFADGYADAPTGSPQYPNLLDLSSATNGLGHNLAVRPPWRVAGVDYRSGCPIDAGNFGANVAVSGGAFTSAFNAKLATFGGTVNTTFPLVEIVNSDLVNFDGWDLRGVIFDLGRMYGSGGAACNDISFTNCLIGGANTGWQYIGNPDGDSLYISSITQYNGVGSTIKNCTFDGGFTGIFMVSNFARFLSLNVGVGHPVDVRYNWFKGSSQQIKRLAGQGSVTFKYNFIDDTFVGAGYYADITAVGPGASNGTGGNLIRVTTDTGRGMSTGFVCEISDVIGIPALTSNPGTHWTVNVIADNVFDLQGSTFSGTYGGGGHFAGNSINNIYNHPNYQEFDMAGASGDLSIDWSFNTTYQATVYGAMGPQMWPGFSIPGVYSPKVTNNTMIAINESIQFFIQGTFGSFTAHPGTIGTPVIGENYFDTSGVIVGPFYGDTDWPLWSRTNNIVMQDGSTLIPT